MPVMTLSKNLGDVLKYEAPNLYSREAAVIAAGQNLAIGTVLGKKTTDGKLHALAPAASDGTETAISTHVGASIGVAIQPPLESQVERLFKKHRFRVMLAITLGYGLIYKASGVFNFAQGAMVYLAALSVVGCIEQGAPLWLAIILAFAIMTAFGIATEKFVLRKLVNQPPIALFMATIGLAFFIEGLAPMLFGSEPRALDLGIVDEPIAWFLDEWNMVISKFDLVAAAVASVLVATLALFFQYTRIGRALRAVADDHQAALSIGIPLQNIWAIVWGVAGFVALVAGMMWGARNGVQFALTFTALKALPVLILGGFTSVPGAIVGGLIIGASEKLAEIYIPPVMQDLFGGNFGGIEGWFPYVLALLFLLVRPEGLFGEKHIDRV